MRHVEAEDTLAFFAFAFGWSHNVVFSIAQALLFIRRVRRGGGLGKIHRPNNRREHKLLFGKHTTASGSGTRGGRRMRRQRQRRQARRRCVIGLVIKHRATGHGAAGAVGASGRRAARQSHGSERSHREGGRLPINLKLQRQILGLPKRRHSKASGCRQCDLGLPRIVRLGPSREGWTE
jgi:hypothetical protein